MDEKYPHTIYGKFVVFCRGVLENIFKNLKTALNIYGQKFMICTGVLEKFIKIFFLPQSLLIEK